MQLFLYSHSRPHPAPQRKVAQHTPGYGKTKWGGLYFCYKMEWTAGKQTLCWMKLISPGLTPLPLGPQKNMELSSPCPPGAKDTGSHSTSYWGYGGVGTVSSPLCLEQLPNLFSSVINTQITPEGTC